LLPHKVVGITGTNGKSTSVALVHHIVQMAGLPCVLGGNIGEAIMAQEPLAPNEQGTGVYVLELSSFQIDITFNLDCDVAALTNITPDHLDRYAGFREYAMSKARLFEMQAARNLAVFGTLEEPCGSIFQREAARRDEVRAENRVALAKIEQLGAMQHEWPTLQGPHNLQNVAVAVAIAEELGVTEAQWRHALPRFRNLPHRMEQVGELLGVTYINDSKATNTASTAPALAAYPPDPAIGQSRRRLHWIVGGLAKEDSLGACEAHLANVAAVYTIGDAGPHFADLLEGKVPVVERCELAVEAVRRAKERAVSGDVVLFSPACASFDQFRDYEKRGEHFRQLVGVINGGEPEDPQSSPPKDIAA